MGRYIKILGIDYGKSHIGLAVSSGTLSSPLKSIEVKENDGTLLDLLNIIKHERPDKIVIGLPEGKMGQEVQKFYNELRALIPDIPIEYQDETLSTQEAQLKGIEAGIGPKKRSEMEHSHAASVILQRYIDNH